MKRTLSSTAPPGLSMPRVSNMQDVPDIQPDAEQPPRPKRRVTIVESQSLAPGQTIWEEHVPREHLSAQRQRDSTTAERPPTQRSTIASSSKSPAVSPAGAALHTPRSSRAADSRSSQNIALPSAVSPNGVSSSAQTSSIILEAPPLRKTLSLTDTQMPLSARGSFAGRGRRPSADNPANPAKLGPASARTSIITGKHASQADPQSNAVRPAPLSARSSMFAGGGGSGRGPQAETPQHPASMAPLSARISAILGPVPLGARGSVFGAGRRSQFAAYEARPMRLSPRASTVLAAAAAAAAPLTPRRSRMSAVSPARLLINLE